jgi:hypothetical protein
MHSAEATSSFFRTLVQVPALAFAYLFLVIGAWGFVPGLAVTDDRRGSAGDHCGAALLGVVHVSVLHNVMHWRVGPPGSCWPALSPRPGPTSSPAGKRVACSFSACSFRASA